MELAAQVIRLVAAVVALVAAVVEAASEARGSRPRTKRSRKH